MRTHTLEAKSGKNYNARWPPLTRTRMHVAERRRRRCRASAIVEGGERRRRRRRKKNVAAVAQRARVRARARARWPSDGSGAAAVVDAARGTRRPNNKRTARAQAEIFAPQPA